MIHQFWLSPVWLSVLLGLIVMLTRDVGIHRVALQVFLLHTLSVNFPLVVARTDAWPSRYPMMAVPTVDSKVELSIVAFRGVDRAALRRRASLCGGIPCNQAAVEVS